MGRSVGASPNVTADRVSISGKQWTVAVGSGIGKLFHIGAQPVQFSRDTSYSAIRPAASSETWLVRATVTLVFAP